MLKWIGSVMARREVMRTAHFAAAEPAPLALDGRTHEVSYFLRLLSMALQKLFRLPTDLLGLLPARSPAYAVS
jgi:hypothetical protein